MEPKSFNNIFGKAIFFTYEISHKIKHVNDDRCHLSCENRIYFAEEIVYSRHSSILKVPVDGRLNYQQALTIRGEY
jgi:hypothetical protein